MSVTVRRAQSAAEIEAAGALTAEAYLADRLIEPTHEYLAELNDAHRRSREAILLVATVPAAREGEPEVVLGTITMAPYGTSYAEVAEPGELELRMLAVAPEARGRGIAETLMRATLREAVLLGFRRLVLSTLDSMQTAQRLYGRLGWTRVAERDWGHEEIHLRVYTWQAPAAPGPLVERATWPPLRVERLEGFELGFSEGFTRRANSAVLVKGSWASLEPAELERRITAVEADYRLAGVTPCVRVDAPVPRGEPGSPGAPTAADEVLARLGYHDVAETLVVVRELAEPPEPAPLGDGVEVQVAERPDERWLGLWAGDRALDHEVGARILTGVRARYLTAVRDGEALAVIRVCLAPALTQGAEGSRWAGLSCLTVAPEHRGNRLATALTTRALLEAREAGASRAFSQLVVGNAASIALHERLGFAAAGAYRYAEPASSEPQAS